MPIANRLIKKYWYPLVYSRPVSALAQKAWYPISTRLMATDELQFMNWAYEEDPPMTLQLAPSDQRNRLFIQLYHRVATQADLTGKQVLEVGCGHGGGASYLVRTLHPASYIGLDLNAAGIEFCQKRHQLPGLDFMQGNAEELPFPDESFDAVLNVESSHLYARFPLFLNEVARVLRPGGYFLYTDVRKRQLVSEWEEELAAVPLRKISEKVIDKEVMRGLEKTQRMMGLVSHRLPALLRTLGRQIDRMQTATFYHALDSGEYSYRLYCFVKDVKEVKD